MFGSNKFRINDTETVEVPMKYIRETLGIGCPFCEVLGDDGFFLDIHYDENTEVYINPFNKELTVDIEGDEDIYFSMEIEHCPLCGRELLVEG